MIFEIPPVCCRFAKNPVEIAFSKLKTNLHVQAIKSKILKRIRGASQKPSIWTNTSRDTAMIGIRGCRNSSNPG